MISLTLIVKLVTNNINRSLINYINCGLRMQIKHRYKKGANAERELAKILASENFAVVRSARSGGSISIPDILGVRNGEVLAFECKTWKEKPRLKLEEHMELVDWCAKAKARGFLAWRKRGEWLFLNLEDVKTKDITKEGLTLEDILNSVQK